MLRKYINLFIELFQELRQKSILGGTMKMRVFGQEFVGQGYMIQSYSTLDQEAFRLSLKKEVDFIKRHKALGRVNIIDAGANLGFYSAVYAMFDNVHVISFEPFPETFKHLQTNIEKNNIDNVTPLKLGLYSKKISMKIGKPDAYKFYNYFEKIFKFSDKEQHGCCSVYTSDKGAPVAEFIKGDECQVISDKNSIDLIKIDVEGSELEALKGLESTIAKHRPMLKIEFNQNALSAAGVSNKDIWDYLEGLGYGKFAICTQKNDLSNWTSMTDMPDLTGSKDILFLD